jgi:hypothetical protein
MNEDIPTQAVSIITKDKTVTNDENASTTTGVEVNVPSVKKPTALERVTAFLNDPNTKPEDVQNLSPEDRSILGRLVGLGMRKTHQKPKNWAKKKRDKRKAQRRARKTQRAHRK